MLAKPRCKCGHLWEWHSYGSGQCSGKSCLCVKYSESLCECGHAWDIHGLTSTKPDELICPVCGKSCKNPNLVKEYNPAKAWEEKLSKEPDPILPDPTTPELRRVEADTDLCKCGHERDEHKKDGGSCFSCPTCPKFDLDDEPYGDELICICGHPEDSHNYQLGPAGEAVCLDCWQDASVSGDKVCGCFVEDTELVSDNFEEVNKAALSQIKSTTTPTGSTVYSTQTPHSNPKGWETYKPTGYGYTNQCNHKPQRIFAHNPTKPGDGWEVYVGTKSAVIPEIAEMDFDIILNCADSGSVLPEHKIPLSFGKKYEKLKAKEVEFDWPDYGVPMIKPEFWGELMQYIKDKKSKVLIFCMGGHGRTGTCISALMIANGWKPRDAEKWIREHYCSKAVESVSQEAYLNKLGEFYGKEESEKSKKAKAN